MINELINSALKNLESISDANNQSDVILKDLFNDLYAYRNNKKELNFSDDFIGLLDRIKKIYPNNPINNILIDASKNGVERWKLNKDKIDYIDTDVKNVTYKRLTKTEPKDPWTKGRTPVKPGKFINKLFSDTYLKSIRNDKELELWTNIFTALTQTFEFELLTGKDLLDAYLHENYACYDNSVPSGTLNNSCMKHANKNEYMRFYADNPDDIALMCVKNDKGKVLGRAVLWKNVTINDKHKTSFLDRTYYTYDWIISLFSDYAIQNGWAYKDINSGYFMSPHNKYKATSGIKIEADVKYPWFKTYPYLDSLSYLSRKGKLLSYSNGDTLNIQTQSGLPGSMWTDVHSYNSKNDITKTDRISVGLRDLVWCENGDKEAKYSKRIDAIQSEKSKKYYDKQYCYKYKNDYIAPDIKLNTCKISGEKGKDFDMIKIDKYGGWVFKDLVFEFDKNWYKKEEGVYSDTFNRFIPNDKTFKLNIGEKEHICPSFDEVDAQVLSIIMGKMIENNLIFSIAEEDKSKLELIKSLEIFEN